MVLVGIAGFLFYRFYMVPQYLNPIAEKFSTYIKDDKVLDSLYSEAYELHNEGILDDSVYTKFITAYNKHTRDDIEYAHSILDGDGNSSDMSGSSTSISAKYASSKVGIEIIQTNDNETGGKSASTYSDARTSDRTRAEDRLEAEKILDSSGEETEKPEIDEESAYKKLKDSMTASEYSTLISIMGKLNKSVLKEYFNNNDKDGLREYLRSELSDTDYRSIVNLGYKYAYLFIEN